MPNIREDLSKDHQEHERTLKKLAEMAESDSSFEGFHRVWVPFERNLLEHLDAEEHSLFCVFAGAHRDEIIALRAEHCRIRYALIELSVCVELHTVKRAAIDDLLNLVREHIEHENRTLHNWLDEDESISSQRGVLAMLSHRARAAEELAEPRSR